MLHLLRQLIFLTKHLRTNRLVVNLCKAFANNPSANIKLSKAQISKVIQSGGILGPLMKNMLQPLAKSVLLPLGLTEAAADAGIRRKIIIYTSNPNINNIK